MRRSMGGLARRIGPRALPGVGQRAIGAGSAMAAATFFAGALAGVVMYTWLDDSSGYFVVSVGIFMVLTLPVAVPSSFLAGVLLWRVLPWSGPLFGTLAGLLSWIVTSTFLSIGALGLAGLGALALVVPVLESFVLTLFGVFAYGTFGYVYAAAFALPLMGIAGALYEWQRVR